VPDFDAGRAFPPAASLGGFAELFGRIAGGVVSIDALTAMIEQRLHAQKDFIEVGDFGGRLTTVARQTCLFRPSPVLEPSLLSYDGTIRRLAFAAYKERMAPQGTLDPARLAVLAEVSWPSCSRLFCTG
jgi:hypothetical protein